MKRVCAIGAVVWLVQTLCPAEDSGKTETISAAGADAVIELPSDELPAEWRLTKKETTGRRGIRNSEYFRGTNVVMRTTWGSGRPDICNVALLDGTNRVANVVATEAAQLVMQEDSLDGYRVFSIISHSTNSHVVVMGEAGFFERYVLDGLNSTPISDLDYSIIQRSASRAVSKSGSPILAYLSVDLPGGLEQ